MSNERNKWERINELVKKGDAASSDELVESVSLSKDMIKKPEGIIAKYKEKIIERKAAIQLIQTWYESHLVVAKHQLEMAVKVKKKQTELDAERFLADLNRKHLEFLQGLEFKNLQEQFEVLDKLGQSTSKKLQEIQLRDWPDNMLDNTINGILELHRRFFEKLMKE